VKNDILDIAKYNRNARWVFLAGGNPTVCPTNYLVEILLTVKKEFPKIDRLSCYAKSLDLIRKSDLELKQFAEAGLTIVYMGLESGSDEILHYMKKGTTAQTLITASKRLMAAGIRVSLYIILGLGGKKYSNIHAEETAKVLNLINPTIFRFRTLNIMNNSPLKEDIDNGSFEILTPLDILKEQYRIIENLSPSLTSAMKNDHISNYSSIETDNIGRDKLLILNELTELIKDPNVKTWKHKGLQQM
jgi:radical SAM superfamily enzyme YgiQ (UPF0313 family)